MKKIFAIFTVLVLITMCGCQTEGEKSTTEETAMAMTIAAMPSIDKIPIIVAEEKGYFEKYGLDVTIENFQSPTDRNAALQGGTVDGVMSDMIADTLYLDSGMDMKITSLIQSDFVVIAAPKSNIKTFNDITEKHTIGVALNTLMEYIADKAGTAEKIMVPDVMTRVEQVLAGSLDLGVVPEPYGSMAVERGAVKVGSASDLDIYAAVMLFPADYIKANSEAVESFYKGYQDAISYLAANSLKDTLATVIDKGEFPESSKNALLNIEFSHLNAPTEAQFKDVLAWMSQHPEFNGPYSYNFKDVTDLSFLEK